MARFFVCLMVALATAAAVIGAPSSVSAQPAVSTSSSAPAAAPKPDFPEVQDALNALFQRRAGLDDTIAKLRDAARKYPKLPSEYVLLYQVFGQVNQGNAAREMLQRAVYQYPNDPEPWVILASIALQEGRLPEAELDFAKANQLLEKYSNADRKPIIQQQALSGMASVAERREQWALAQARLEELLRSSPSDIAALQRLARAKFWQQNVKEAYADLKKAKQIDLDNVAKDTTHKAREQMLPDAAMLAEYYDMYERQPKFKGPSANAEKFFKYALQQYPDDLSLRRVVTVWALENGEINLAKEQAKEALRIEADDRKLPPAKQKYPGSTIGRMLSGYVAIWDKKFPEAQENFEKLLIEAPNDFAVRNNLALALIEQDDPVKKNRALDIALTNYQNNKDNLEAASTLSWIYYKLEKYDLALAVMDAVLKSMGGNIPNNPDTATYLAHMLYHNDNGKNGMKFKAKQVLQNFLDSGRPFSMRPEAQKLYELVKDEQPPKSETPPATAPKVTP